MKLLRFLAVILLPFTALALDLGSRKAISDGVSIRMPKNAEVSLVESPDGKKSLKAQMTEPANIQVVVQGYAKKGGMDQFAKDFAGQSVVKTEGSKLVDIDPYKGKTGLEGKVIVVERPGSDVRWEVSFAFEVSAEKAVVATFIAPKADLKLLQTFVGSIVDTIEIEK